MRKPVRTALVVASAIALFLVLVLGSGSRFGDSVREWLVPLKVAPHMAGTRARDAAGGGRGAPSRRELEQQVSALRIEVADLARLEQENERLRRDLEFVRQQRLKLMAAEVVGRDDITGWWKTVTIDRGSEDRLVVDRPVVVPDGLVGRVCRVGRRTSDVLLLSDTTMRVGARIVRTGVNGVVRGMGSDSRGRELQVLCAPRAFRLDYVSVEADVQKGDEVVTSGLGGIFPPDLRLGTVLDVTVDSSGLCRSATVAAAADLGALRYVFVVMQ